MPKTEHHGLSCDLSRRSRASHEHLSRASAQRISTVRGSARVRLHGSCSWCGHLCSGSTLALPRTLPMHDACDVIINFVTGP